MAIFLFSSFDAIHLWGYCRNLC